jgi:5-methyltetrahydrofolate--homocysteine methyltransferase
VLSNLADTLLMVYPNAGLPNELGEYDELPETTAGLVSEWARNGQVNILGGCCGSSPEHIAAIVQSVKGVSPRVVPAPDPAMRLAGLEAFIVAS